jgi:hypothetical protein
LRLPEERVGARAGERDGARLGARVTGLDDLDGARAGARAAGLDDRDGADRVDGRGADRCGVTRVGVRALDGVVDRCGVTRVGVRVGAGACRVVVDGRRTAPL